VALERARVRPAGIDHARRFLLVDAAGQFVTQRTRPALALVRTDIVGPSLVIDAPGSGSITVPLAPEGPRRTVRIWRDDVGAVVVGGPASALLSQHLGLACSLVFMPDDVVRPVDPRYGEPGDRVGFADGYPILLAARASLADLNARLDAPVPMERFRPNLVVDGGLPFDEDRHRRARIGALALRMPKRCSRCQVTLVDQGSAAIGKEPLRALASYRRTGNKVFFGQNAIPDGEGLLALGDEVTYLEPQPG
jgi:uncharacterized protein YcbX